MAFVFDCATAGVADDVAVDAADDVAAGTAAAELTAAVGLRFAWFATATVPATVKNDAMLRPPSSQRVAAAG